MFERYTDDARKVIFFARYEASRLHAAELHPDHLWLGLLRQNKRLIKRLAPQVTEARVHARMAPPPADAQRVSLSVDMPLDPLAAKALAAATAEADTLGNRYVTSEYLVNALLSLETQAKGK
jgi:ATP-dependent Clp protease ATP-binding subunit ClpC